MNNKFYDSAFETIQSNLKEEIVNLWKQIDYNNIGEYHLDMLLDAIFNIYVSNRHKSPSLPIKDIQQKFNDFILKQTDTNNYNYIDVNKELVDIFSFKYIQETKL